MHRLMIALVLALALALAACGDGAEEAADDAAEDPTEDPTEDDPPASEDPTEDPTEQAGTVEVTAVDYGYEGLPEGVPTGTTLQLTNASELEVHEIVLVRIPDDEQRPLPELLQLEPADVEALMMANLVGVSVAPPASEGIVVEGDLTVTEPGRYALVCIIPTGADPDEYMAAAAESDGPPDVEGGPPHIVQGMFAELTVEG